MVLVLTPTLPASDPAAAERLFAAKVLPVLKAKCFACRGEDATQLKGGLDGTAPR